MAKRRMISQELIYDEEFNSLSIEAQNLFIRMLTVADDCGVVPGNPYTLCTLTNPPGRIKKRCNEYLSEIVATGMGRMVEYDDKHYFLFKRESFQRHQSYIINKRVRSEYLKMSSEAFDTYDFTADDGHMVGICGAYPIESSKQTAVSSKQKAESRKSGRPENLDEVAAYCLEIGLPATEAERFFDYYEANGWVQGKQGKPIVNWKAAARHWKSNKGKFNAGTQSGNTGVRQSEQIARATFTHDDAKKQRLADLEATLKQRDADRLAGGQRS